MGIMKTLAVVAATLLPIGAQAFDMNAMTQEERSIFRQEVRAYLLENPQVLVEAMNVLEQQQQIAETRADDLMVQQNVQALHEDGISYVGGNPDGDITMVEFLDYRCGYCRKAHTEVSELLKSDGNIRLIVKEYPILGEDSTISSQVAVATLQTLGPDAYAKMHEELMAYNGPMNEKSVRMLAHRAGVNADSIIARMNGPEVADHIAQMHELGRKMQVSGTPTFVVGDTILRGYLPIASMRQVVAAEREAIN